MICQSNPSSKNALCIKSNYQPLLSQLMVWICEDWHCWLLLTWNYSESKDYSHKLHDWFWTVHQTDLPLCSVMRVFEAAGIYMTWITVMLIAIMWLWTGELAACVQSSSLQILVYRSTPFHVAWLRFQKDKMYYNSKLVYKMNVIHWFGWSCHLSESTEPVSYLSIKTNTITSKMCICIEHSNTKQVKQKRD